MGITAARLKSLGLVDKVISEPLGGAHRDPQVMAANLKKALLDGLSQVGGLTTEALLEARYARLMAYGRFTEKPVAAN